MLIFWSFHFEWLLVVYWLWLSYQIFVLLMSGHNGVYLCTEGVYETHQVEGSVLLPSFDQLHIECLFYLIVLNFY